MVEEIRAKRCTCDICKKVYEVQEKEESPLTKLRLPVTSCDEYGSYEGVTVADVDVCAGCLNDIDNLLSNEYIFKNIRYGGLSVIRLVLRDRQDKEGN